MTPSTMADPQDLLALAAKVEAATGPDRELDAVIAATIRVCHKDWRWADQYLTWEGRANGRVYLYSGGPSFEVPTFTTSLDAAMTLVPDGWYWMAGNRDRVTPRAYVENGKPAFVGFSSRRNPERLWFEVTAATPALALTAAALRARAAIREGESADA